MRVLVTGGHGFIGAHLCARLVAAGWAVRVLARPGADLSSLDGLPIEVVRGDVTDPLSLPTALTGVRRVFHAAAALKGLRESDFWRVNAAGARNMAAAAARVPALERFVVVSSLAAAGPSADVTTLVTEQTPERPLTWYGRTKLEGERWVRSFQGLPSVIVRPPIVYGPRGRELLPYFRFVRRGVRPVLGRGERRYSLIFVEDLVDGLLRVADVSTPPGEVFCLTGPEAATWSDLGRMVAAALEVRSVEVRLPDWLGVLAGRTADAVARWRRRPQVFSSQKLIEMRCPAWVCSGEKAARALNWSASTPLAQGLARTARWYRDHGWL